MKRRERKKQERQKRKKRELTDKHGVTQQNKVVWAHSKMEEGYKEGCKHETESKILKRRGKIKMDTAGWESGHKGTNKIRHN
jgi:hypothetical protein